MSVQTFLDGRVVLHGGDCRAVLAALADNSIDSIVTDPPYALVSIVKRFGKPGSAPVNNAGTKAGNSGDPYARAAAGFMGKQWDTGETAFAVEFWAQCLRVLKPGGHVAAFSGTRTYHRLAVAIEDAGFEIRDQLAWTYGTGFPKSHDVSKAIDKMDATHARRERALRFTAWMRSTGLTSRQVNEATGTVMASHYLTDKEQPSVAIRDHFEALRPLISVEIPDWVERMVDERTVELENYKARAVIGQHDKPAQAAVWRQAYAGGAVADAGDVTLAYTDEAAQWQGWGTALKPGWEPIVLARKPLEGAVAANVLKWGTGALNLDGCRVGDAGGTATIAGDRKNKTIHALGDGLGAQGGAIVSTGSGRHPANIVHDGSEEVVSAFPDAAPGKAGARNPNGKTETNAFGDFGAQPGVIGGHDDNGGSAARFFYSAKAGATDRIGSKHPTVKPVDLMQWLCRLITPPGGTVLDPFSGTGTTGEAAWREGFSAVLVEREAEYQADIAERMRLCLAGPGEKARAIAKRKAPAVDAGPLFGGVDTPPRDGRRTYGQFADENGRRKGGE
jgi:DNA modification methylase